MQYTEPKTDWSSSDGVSADDFNRIEQNTEALQQTTIVTLTAEGWVSTDSGEFTQTVSVADMKESYEPQLVRAMDSGISLADRKAYNKWFGVIAEGIGTTGEGQITYKVSKKPDIAITIGLKGV